MICSIAGCSKPHLARGWCSTHYARWRKHGDPLVTVITRYHGRACSVGQCNEPVRAKGLCKPHYQRDYYQRNRERLREDYKRWCAENPEKSKAAQRRWYEANREKAIAYSLQRFKDYPELARRAAARRRARKLENGTVPYRESDICERDKWTCQLCGKKVNKSLRWPDRGSASIDHIVPLVEGGADAPSNVQLAHIGCNWTKHTGSTESGDQLMLEVS